MKEIVTTDGGVLKIDDIILKIGAGCVVKDTEITMINHDDNEAIKSLFALGLVDAVPRVVEFLPDSLKFLKPVDLTIGFEMSTEMSTPDSQPLVLYGYYDCGYAKTVWKQVNILVEDRRAKGIVNIRIDGFCFYSLILTKRGKLPRILSHLNHSFACRAYAFYRRLPSMDTIDIAVVILSEFVDERKEEDIKQLRDHLNKGFVEGAKGIMMRVHTDHHFEICFNFPGVKSTPLSFKVDKSELDKDGFLIDHFKRIKVKCPANGMVQISQINRSAENQLLWSLDVREKEQGTVKEKNDYGNWN